jgi:hypothetical protein
MKPLRISPANFIQHPVHYLGDTIPQTDISPLNPRVANMRGCPLCTQGLFTVS